MRIVKYDTPQDALIRLRAEMFPEETFDEHWADLEALLGEDYAVLGAHDENGALIAFADAALRTDYVNGCESTPVLFLEAIYVRPTHRRRGVAHALTDALVQWGRSKGCSEFASDALLDNHQSHAFHSAIGFAETERVVYFKKPL